MQYCPNALQKRDVRLLHEKYVISRTEKNIFSRIGADTVLLLLYNIMFVVKPTRLEPRIL